MSLLTDLATPLPRRKPGPPPPPPANPGAAASMVPRPLPPKRSPCPADGRPACRLPLPIVCSMFVPLAALDLWTSLRQAVAFPMLGIPKVRRGGFFHAPGSTASSRDIAEKVTCAYCSYSRGVISFAGVIDEQVDQRRHAEGPAASEREPPARRFSHRDHGDFHWLGRSARSRPGECSRRTP